LPAPNPNTVRLRIAAIPNRERFARRSHRKTARDQYAPRPGVFDSARQPLDLIQIDHTKLGIIVVDEEQRLPIGRPWITLAIDVYSRTVAGFYISLDPPGAVGTGLCILPFVERTIQPYGIAIDGIRYYGDVLRRFIGASTDNRKRSFLFRRDPRDISTVYFWDPESQRYCAIPYRNTTYPAISLWELREIRRKLSESGEAQVDEAAIFAAYARLREHEARATTETKRARRVRVRRPVASPALPSSDPAEPALLSDPADIVPFAIEELA
jgi:hypothetical protein